jgi:hypothetical protein
MLLHVSSLLRCRLRWPGFGTIVKPNNSFKPKLLRSGNGAAEEACHAVTCATQFGLTLVLGSGKSSWFLASGFIASASATFYRSLCFSRAACRFLPSDAVLRTVHVRRPHEASNFV